MKKLLKILFHLDPEPNELWILKDYKHHILYNYCYLFIIANIKEGRVYYHSLMKDEPSYSLSLKQFKQLKRIL